MNDLAHQPTIAVNLLNQDEFSQSAVGRVMLWALSIGRYVVVFTELIVILSFMSRFKLDRDLTDLNEAIARQKAIILSYGTLETDFRFTQNQLALVRQTQTILPPATVLAILSQSTPADVKLETLSLTENTLQLSALALSPQGFYRFITNLYQNSAIKHLSLGDVGSKDQGLTLNFELTADLAPKL